MKKKSKAKKIVKITLFSVLGVLVAAIAAAAFILYGRIATMASVKYVGSDLYTMNFQQDYHLDKALDTNIKSESDLLKFICDDMFFDYQVDANLEKYACSAFVTKTPDGKYLGGRSFGLGGTDTLCVYTHPSDGYASISTVSTDMLNVGADNAYPTTSLEGRAALLAAPYIAVDGLNEKGLFTALLDLSMGETHMETGNRDLTVTMAVRLLIDRAATVDEAIELLRNYDIHTGHGWTQHLFVGDASGDGAVIEWHKGQMKVVKSPICTNFRLSSKLAQDDPTGMCERFDILHDTLEKHPENSPSDAMDMLEAVKQEYDNNIHTEWSIVYHLTDFSMDISVDMDFDNVYHLEIKDF
ncbi:linear amide C-N hydrolase [Ruminococcus sp.]|uniref:linear amide C-N hydrolase n=1 Tax=Ruminococcus sp. TaxID=41978 RepID=UPI00386C03AC